MAKCEQCGAEFSNWFGDVKRICPQCEQRAANLPQPQLLPPDGSTQPAAPLMQLPAPIATRILMGINIAVYLAMVLTTRQFVNFDTPTVVHWGADFGLLTLSGEWWRMLTSTFLHGGIIHIAVNMWALRNLGYTAELFYGRRNFLIIYLLSGLAGSAGTLVWNPARVSVGASGAIFGVAGALAALVYFKKLPVDRAVLRRDIGSIGGMILVNLFLGASIGIIDNSAHVGGLLAGTILGFALPAMIFRAEREKSETPGYMATAAVLAAILGLAMFCRAKVAPDLEVYSAEMAYEAGDKAGALAHVQRATELHPQSFYANSFIGALYLDNGENAKALPFLEKANQLDPTNAGVKQALAQARQASPQ
jgi:membrane associated rhomboid family serine protease